MELSQRDTLFNILLNTVKKHGSGMEVGLVRAVLAEVDGEIAQKLGRMQFDAVQGNLKERKPRECGRHSRGGG